MGDLQIAKEELNTQGRTILARQQWDTGIKPTSLELPTSAGGKMLKVIEPRLPA